MAKSIYFDYAATAPVDSAVMREMQPYFSDKFGNPGSAHLMGQDAFRLISRSRGIVVRAFGCDEDGVIFTASATEANNLALQGAARGITNYQLPITSGGEPRALSERAQASGQGSERSEKSEPSTERAVSPGRRVVAKSTGSPPHTPPLPHIITTAIEHDSVFETCRAMEREGLVEVTYVGVSAEGIVNPDDIAKALRPETILVSVMYANNEIGTIQPLFEISKIIQDFKKRKFQIPNSNYQSNPNYPITQLPVTNYPLLHTDAVQAAQYLGCDMKRLGVDLMTISSHKIYGPKGAAALCINSDAGEVGRGFPRPRQAERGGRILDLIYPMMFGGGQESGLRSGTENVPAIVGFGKAVELAILRREKESKRLIKLRDYFIAKLLALDKNIALNGSATSRLPNNVNVSFLGFSSDALITMFDQAGIFVSAGSACEARAAEPSRVLAGLGISKERQKSAIRFSFGRNTAKQDLDYTVKIVAQLMRRK
jgi:cysteine desulfurase